MAKTITLETFLLDAYLKDSTPEDFMVLHNMKNLGLDTRFNNSAMADAMVELLDDFYSARGEEYSTGVIRLLLDEADSPDFRNLSVALLILQSASIAPAISDEVIARLADVQNKFMFTSMVEMFFWYGGPARMLDDDPKEGAGVLRKHYANAPSIGTVLDRFERIKATPFKD